LNKGNASLLKEADRLLDESKEARERALVLEEDKETLAAELRSLKACHDLLTQEKAKQDQELRLVHENKDELRNEVEAQEPLWRRRSRSNDRDTGAPG
jgi:hypothetical protein